LARWYAVDSGHRLAGFQFGAHANTESMSRDDYGKESMVEHNRTSELLVGGKYPEADWKQRANGVAQGIRLQRWGEAGRDLSGIRKD
jgi:hypothetical protein